MPRYICSYLDIIFKKLFIQILKTSFKIGQWAGETAQWSSIFLACMTLIPSSGKKMDYHLIVKFLRFFLPSGQKASSVRQAIWSVFHGPTACFLIILIVSLCTECFKPIFLVFKVTIFSLLSCRSFWIFTLSWGTAEWFHFPLDSYILLSADKTILYWATFVT